MSILHAAMTGFDATPRIHPQFGAWGTTPTMRDVDLPLLSRCLALQDHGQTLLWFSHALTGLSCASTLQLRQHVAGAVGLSVDQIVWSTSQTHASGDTNCLFGYIGTDEEIDRAGFETDTYWKMMHRDGFRLAPPNGAWPTHASD